MLVVWFVESFGALLTSVFELVPEAPFDGPAMGSMTLHVPPWVPINPLIVCLGAAVVMNASMIVYTFANWIWRHIPQVLGFGPGGG